MTKEAADKATRPYQQPEQQPDVVKEEAVLYETLPPKQKFQRPPCQYTVEELEAVLEQAEAEDNIDSEEIHAYFKKKYPFLCL